MPQSNQRVARFDLAADLNNYYMGSVATIVHKGKPTPCLIQGYHNEGGEVKVFIRRLSEGKTEWERQEEVPNEALDYVLPHLGLVEYEGAWFHLHRHPARRMRKGFNEECIGYTALDLSYELPNGIRDPKIVHQVWYGNEQRVTHNIVVVGKKVYYTTDHVADINDDGLVVLIPEREKLGEIVCKALANNWDSVTSKTSVRTLP